MAGLGAYVAAAGAALLMFGAVPSAFADDPPFIVEAGDLSLSSTGGTKTVHIVAAGPVDVVVTGLAVQVNCGEVSDAPTTSTDGSTPLSCVPEAGGIVTVTLSAPVDSTAGSGLMIVSDPITRVSASRTLAIAGPPEATQPKKVTLVVEGCADWYDTWLLTCPESDRTRTVSSRLAPPPGEAVITGEAGTATVTVKEQAGGDIEVVGLDGFGTATGSLGTGAGAVEVTARRRAPLLVGVVAVAFGAALAAAVAWFTKWAVASTAAIETRARYDTKHAALQKEARRVERALDATGLGPARAVWVIDEPAALAPDDTDDETKVAAYSTAANALLASLSELTNLLAAHDRVARLPNGRTSKLVTWMRTVILRGPHPDDYPASRDAVTVADAALADLPVSDPTVAAVLDADGPGAVYRAVAGPAPVAPTGGALVRVLKYASASMLALNLTAPSTRPSGPVHPPRWIAALGGIVLLIGLAVAASGSISVVLGIIAGALAAAVCAAALVRLPITTTALLVVGVFLVAMVVSDLPTAGVLTLYVLAAAALYLAARRSGEQRKLRILVAALIGWILAAAFGGADALDSTKAWGDFGDIAATIGASFAVGGAAQLLRFGFPTKAS